MDLKERILLQTIELFNKKGLKFTMDDIAVSLKISKKTIYTVFNNKDKLLISMVNYIFDSIKQSEKEIFENENYTTVDKIRAILGALPEGYKDIDFRQLHCLKDKYPDIYKQVEVRLETGWESTIWLLEKGKEEGVIRDVKIPLIKLMLESVVEQFFQRDVLIKNEISYAEALDEVVNIIIDGIKV